MRILTRGGFDGRNSRVFDRKKQGAIRSATSEERDYVFGTAPDYIFDKYREQGIDILQFDSDYMATHRKADDA